MPSLRDSKRCVDRNHGLTSMALGCHASGIRIAACRDSNPCNQSRSDGILEPWTSVHGVGPIRKSSHNVTTFIKHLGKPHKKMSMMLRDENENPRPSCQRTLDHLLATMRFVAYRFTSEHGISCRTRFESFLHSAAMNAVTS